MKQLEPKTPAMRLQETVAHPHRGGAATIIASGDAIVPVSHLARLAPRLTALRGAACGCYGNAARYVNRLRDEWQ